MTPVLEVSAEKPPRYQVPSRVTTYVQLHRDFAFILVGAIILAALVVIGDTLRILGPARLILALVYIFYVPGYCLASALFPEVGDLDTIERLGLSIALSIAVVPVMTLALSVLPWGIRPWPILLGEYGATFLFSAIAIWRRARVPVEARYSPALLESRPGAWRPSKSAERRVYVAFGGVILLGVTLAGWILAVPAPDRFTTEFYILRADGLAEGYPRVATPGETLTVTAGIVNRERGDQTYRVEVWVVDGWNPNHRTQVWKTSTIKLSPGESRQMPISWRMPRVGDDQEVQFLLFTSSSPKPYRQLRIWLNVIGNAPVAMTSASPQNQSDEALPVSRIPSSRQALDISL